MLQTWKFSKGILLTVIFTAAVSFSVLGYAYRQNRSSEILTGVIAGLTIILGMITAEWLRSAREQVEMTRSRFYEMVTHIERFLYNFDEYMQDQFSHEQSRHMDDFIHVASPMHLLAQTTQWPQPNAKKIREVALEVVAKLGALQSDADENGYIWTLEERMTIASDLFQLYPLIWDHKPEEFDADMQRIGKYRKTPRNEGTRDAWKKERAK